MFVGVNWLLHVQCCMFLGCALSKDGVATSEDSSLPLSLNVSVVVSAIDELPLSEIIPLPSSITGQCNDNNAIRLPHVSDTCHVI